MKTRKQQIEDFLQAHDWHKAKRKPLQGDASPRRYTRLEKSDQKCVLMDAPYDGSEDEYSRAAQLAGSNPHAFVCLANELTKRGFSAPHILACDLENSLMLLEDMGGNIFAAYLEENPEQERVLYEAAIDCLAALYRSTFLQNCHFGQAEWLIRPYTPDVYLTESNLLPEWYVPEYHTALTPAIKAEWERIWARLFPLLDSLPQGLALRDFHAENLFWLPNRTGPAQVGLIDFQDALFAHPAYDLVSLLEDARRDVSPERVVPLIERFCHKAGIDDVAGFKTGYAILGAQRNAKILGIFVRLARRDGKQHYLDFLPRMKRLFGANISHPDLQDLRQWCEKHAPSLLEAA